MSWVIYRELITSKLKNFKISLFNNPCRILKFQNLTCKILKFKIWLAKILKFQDLTCRILKFLNLVTYPWITHRDNSRYFTYGLIRLGANTCSLFSKMWQRAYLIRDAPHWRSRRRMLCAVRVITIIWKRKPYPYSSFSENIARQPHPAFANYF